MELTGIFVSPLYYLKTILSGLEAKFSILIIISATLTVVQG